jgi:hypothetical protein
VSDIIYIKIKNNKNGVGVGKGKKQKKHTAQVIPPPLPHPASAVQKGNSHKILTAFSQPLYPIGHDNMGLFLFQLLNFLF